MKPVNDDAVPGSPFKGVRGVRRVLNALGYSIAGISAGWRHEAAFRQVSLLALVLVPLALLLDIAAAEKAILIATTMLMPIVELINSALEATVDRVSLEKHPLSKRAKDLGSAAQLLTLVTVALVWLVILL